MSTCEHKWTRSGMFLMKYIQTMNSRGDITGEQLAGGNKGYVPFQTPEVEVCACCGLLRIPVPEPGK